MLDRPSAKVKLLTVFKELILLLKDCDIFFVLLPRVRWVMESVDYEFLGAEENAGSFVEPHGCLRTAQSISLKFVPTPCLYPLLQSQEIPSPTRRHSPAVQHDYQILHCDERVP